VQATGRDGYGKEEDKIDFEAWTHFVCTTFERAQFFFLEQSSLPLISRVVH
jgi:hypothetical protein